MVPIPLKTILWSYWGSGTHSDLSLDSAPLYKYFKYLLSLITVAEKIPFNIQVISSSLVKLQQVSLLNSENEAEY
jgi:hypothetical protein